MSSMAADRKLGYTAAMSSMADELGSKPRVASLNIDERLAQYRHQNKVQMELDDFFWTYGW